MSDDDEEVLIQLLIEQMALKIQMAELNFAALIDKLGVSYYKVYRVRAANLGRIVQEGRQLAQRRRAASL